MRLGYGTTVWFNGLNEAKLDGIAVYTQELYKEFQNMETSLYPLVFSQKTPIDFKDTEHSITHPKLSFPLHSGLHTLLKLPFNELQSYQKEIDLFFAPDHHIPAMKNVPVVATVMDIIPLVHPEWVSSRLRYLKNFLFKKTILSADHIITISEFSKNDIVKHLNIAPEKISVVDLGVNKEFFKRASIEKKQLVLDKYHLKKDFFLFIGTLQPRKNVIRIIQAHRLLPDKVRENHPLVIVGKYGWSSQDLMDEIRIMEKLQDGVWLSYIEQEELFILLQSALALVYPSLYEGFGLPVIEGFASGCPVITSNVTSLPEVAGNAAVQVNPTSIKEINMAMLKIHQDIEYRENLIEEGTKRVQKYNWNNVAKAHMDIFNKMLLENH